MINIINDKLSRELIIWNYYIPLAPLALGAFIGFFPTLNWLGIVGLFLLGTSYLFFCIQKNNVTTRKKWFLTVIICFILSVVFVTGSIWWTRFMENDRKIRIANFDFLYKNYCNRLKYQNVIYQNSINQKKLALASYACQNNIQQRLSNYEKQQKSFEKQNLKNQNKLDELVKRQGELLCILNSILKSIVDSKESQQYGQGCTSDQPCY